jgi:DNA-binding XRE family transcriptional regulator
MESMSAKARTKIDYRSVELDGVRYVIVRESIFDRLCERAKVEAAPAAATGPPEAATDLDGISLAEKLLRRRLAARLSQAELARRAGVRPETLNRIERGHTTPDFATIRKLVVAMDAAEAQFAKKSIS